jgi:hypothetical protein
MGLVVYKSVNYTSNLQIHVVFLYATQINCSSLRLSLYLIKHHPAKEYGGVEAELHIFLTWAPDPGERSASCPNCFTPRERAPSTHLMGGWEDQSQSGVFKNEKCS